MKHLSYNYERNKCEDILYNLLGDKGEVTLKEKMWLQTTYGGYEFTVCKVKASSCLLTVNYELYNKDGGIHCSHRMLTTPQLRELTRLVSNSILEITMTQSDILMDEVYPLFRQLEKIRYRNNATHSLKSIEFDFNQGSIKFTYNNDSKNII